MRACTIQFSHIRKNVTREYCTKRRGEFVTYTCSSSMDLFPRYLIATGANTRLYTIVGYSHANPSRVYIGNRQLHALAHGREKQRRGEGRLYKERERERCERAGLQRRPMISAVRTLQYPTHTPSGADPDRECDTVFHQFISPTHASTHLASPDNSARRALSTSCPERQKMFLFTFGQDRAY